MKDILCSTKIILQNYYGLQFSWDVSKIQAAISKWKVIQVLVQGLVKLELKLLKYC